MDTTHETRNEMIKHSDVFYANILHRNENKIKKAMVTYVHLNRKIIISCPKDK